MQLMKDLYITNLTISNIANQPYVIEAVGRYISRITLNESSVTKFSIELSRDLVGSNIVITLDSKEGYQLSPHDVLISRVEKVNRRRIHQIPSPSLIDETEFRAVFYTPKKDPTSLAIPCPNFALRLDLTESEYEEILNIGPATVFSVECRIR